MRKAAIAARWVVWIAKKACCSKRSSRLLKVVFYTVCSAMLMYYAITLTGFVSPETLIATFEGGSYSTGAGKSGDEGEAKGGGSALLWGSSASSFWFQGGATASGREKGAEVGKASVGVGKMRRFATEVGVVEKQKELLEVAPGTLASGEAEQGVIDETVVTSTIGGDEGVGAAATATAQPADPGGSTTGRLLARTKTTSTKPPSLASGASLTQQSGTALGDDQQDEHSALAPSDEDPHTHPAPVPEQQVRSQQDLEDGGDPLAPDQPPPEVVAVADEEQDGTGGTDNSGPRASGTTATAASAKGNLKGTGSSASPSPTPTGGGANAGERNSQSDSLLQSENGSKNAFGTTDDRDETERAAEQEAGDEGEGEGGAEEEELNAHPVRLHSVSMLVFLVLSVMLVLALSLWYAAKTKRCLLPRWMRNLWERKSGLSISLDREEMLEKNLSNPRAASHFESQGHPRDTSVHLIPPIKNIPPPSSAQIVSGRSNSKTKTSSRELGSCTSSTGGGPPPGGGAGGHQQGPAPPLPAAARATRTPSLSSTTTTTHTDGVGAGSMISVERTMRFGRYRRVGDVVLGHGSCKVVYLAENLETGERVAWSQIGMQDDEHGQAMRSSRALSVSSQLEQTKSELQLLIAATQPGVNDKLNPSVSDRSKILKLLDYSFDTEEATNYHSYGNPPETIRIHMITELHPGGCLRKWHYNITHNIHPESNELGFKFAGEMCRELKNCAISISQGLRYLHSTKIIHRDVRPDNIFVKVDRGGKIQDAVLADLGLFRFAREKEGPTGRRRAKEGEQAVDARGHANANASDSEEHGERHEAFCAGPDSGAPVAATDVPHTLKHAIEWDKCTPTPTFAGILHGSHAFLDPAPPPARQGQEHQPGTTPVDSASDREQETTSSAPGGGSQQPRQAYAAYATITTQEHRFTISGNDAYYPPEVIRQLIESPPNLMDFHAKIRCSFDSKLDIYMFGLSILEMFLDGRRRTFVRNYSDYDEFEDYVSAFEHEKSKILSEARHKYAEDQFSHMQLNHFLSNSLKSDPERRWTANDCFFGLTQAYLGFSALDRDGATPTEGTNHLHLPRGTRSSRDHGDRSSRGEPNSPVAGGLVGPEHTGRKESHDNSSTISCTPLPAGSTVGFDDLESEP
eukprot:g4834.t1